MSLCLLGAAATGCGKPAAHSPATQAPAQQTNAAPVQDGPVPNEHESAAGAPWADEEDKLGAEAAPSLKDEQPTDQAIGGSGGAAPAPAKPAPRRGSPAEAESQAVNPEHELSQTFELLARQETELSSAVDPAQPDCPRAKKLTMTICELAARICRLERESVTSTQGLCEDAEARCNKAAQRYAEACSN